jgi:hypothetical protein
MLKRATEPSWSKCLVRIHGDGRQAHALWCWNWTANACSALDPEATVLIERSQLGSCATRVDAIGRLGCTAPVLARGSTSFVAALSIGRSCLLPVTVKWRLKTLDRKSAD